MSLLLVDAGNSRIKWSTHVNNSWHERGWTPSKEPLLEQQWQDLAPPARILASNVAGPAVAGKIGDACRRWGIAPSFVQSRRAQCGVSNGYSVAASLGSDRWCALIAAHHLRPDQDVLVVQAGTAVTVDSVDRSGRFLGGLILPGLNLMLETLARETVGLTQQPGEILPFPVNTADAMRSGAIDAIAGAIERSFRRLGNGATCLLGGGDADILLPFLNIPAQKQDKLVLEGLLLIALEN